MTLRDKIYQGSKEDPAPFEFNERVAEVFPDMIARSVPGYAATLRLIGSIADRHVPVGGNVYDLGCSLGAASRSVVKQIGDRATITAVDSSEAMVNRLTSELEQDRITCIHPVHQDIRDTRIKAADLTLMNFTLQFIPVQDRLPLLRKIAAGTRPGGVLVLSEKIRFDDPKVQEEMTSLHEAFKRENGYDDLEIAGKRKALETVLIPESLHTHHARLKEAGFAHSTVWLQCFNFVSLIAVVHS
jgi:tRNA (cmo5U34)-methyltransferase